MCPRGTGMEEGEWVPGVAAGFPSRYLHGQEIKQKEEANPVDLSLRSLSSLPNQAFVGATSNLLGFLTRMQG